MDWLDVHDPGGRIETSYAVDRCMARKPHMGLKVLVDDMKAAVRAVLERAVKAARDRQFLKEQAWLG